MPSRAPPLRARLSNHLLGGRDPLHDLEPGVHAEREHALFDGRVANVRGADVLHHQLAQGWRHHHHLVDTLTALEAGAITRVAAAALEEAELPDLGVEAEGLQVR